MTLAERWRKANLSLTRQEARTLERTAAGLGQNVAAYALERYSAEGCNPWPNVPDFIEWSEKETFPDELACRAYLDKDPALVALADELETLRGAWFPSADTADRIMFLEKRLTAALA